MKNTLFVIFLIGCWYGCMHPERENEAITIVATIDRPAPVSLFDLVTALR